MIYNFKKIRNKILLLHENVSLYELKEISKTILFTSEKKF